MRDMSLKNQRYCPGRARKSRGEARWQRSKKASWQRCQDVSVCVCREHLPPLHSATHGLRAKSPVIFFAGNEGLFTSCLCYTFTFLVYF